MTPVVQHRPEFHQPRDDSMHVGTEASGAKAEATGGSVHEGNTKLLPWLVLMALLCGISLGATVFCLIRMASIEGGFARMSVHIMSNDALLLREGLMQPGDMWRGPEANLEYGRRDQPRGRK